MCEVYNSDACQRRPTFVSDVSCCCHRCVLTWRQILSWSGRRVFTKTRHHLVRSNYTSPVRYVEMASGFAISTSNLVNFLLCFVSRLGEIRWENCSHERGQKLIDIAASSLVSTFRVEPARVEEPPMAAGLCAANCFWCGTIKTTLRIRCLRLSSRWTYHLTALRADISCRFNRNK